MLKLQVFAKRSRLVPDNLIGEVEERIRCLAYFYICIIYGYVFRTPKS